MKIEAAVLEQTGHALVLEELELSPPGAGEVLVRLGASGVCSFLSTFAEACVVPERSCVPIDRDVPFDGRPEAMLVAFLVHARARRGRSDPNPA